MLLAPLLAVAPWTSLAPAAAGLGRPRACAQAQLIAGELRCDEELLSDSASVCPRVPVAGLGPGDAAAFGPGGCSVGRIPPDQLAALAQPVDVNAASAAELASLPGIGPKLAARIIAGRPYASVDALIEVRGIGPAKLRALRPRARVGPED